MSGLFKNIVDFMPVGIEDYKSEGRNKPILSVRNFYAGVFVRKD